MTTDTTDGMTADEVTTEKHPVLLVDDESEILFSLRGLLRTEFELHTAESGAEAMEILRRQPIHAIMTDQRMPNMTGVELLRRAKEERPEAVRMVFTGYADIKAVIDAINQGEIYRYLTKPWDPDELVAVFQGRRELGGLTPPGGLTRGPAPPPRRPGRPGRRARPRGAPPAAGRGRRPPSPARRARPRGRTRPPAGSPSTG